MGITPIRKIPFLHEEDVIHNDTFTSADQRRKFKRDAPEHGNSDVDDLRFYVGQASGSSPTLITALTRIDDAKVASRCRSRVHALGPNDHASSEHAYSFRVGDNPQKRRKLHGALNICNSRGRPVPKCSILHDFPNDSSASGGAACDFANTKKDEIIRLPIMNACTQQSQVLNGQDAPT